MKKPFATASEVIFPSGAVYFDLKGKVIGAANREARQEYAASTKEKDAEGKVVYTLPLEKVDTK